MTIDPKLSEGARDRAAYSGADAAAKDIAHHTGNDDDLARTGKKVFPGTSVGAPCDMINPGDTLQGPDSDQNFPNSPKNPSVDSGHRIDSASLAPNPDQSKDYGTARYDIPAHDAAAREHALRLQKSGKVEVNAVVIPKV